MQLYAARPRRRRRGHHTRGRRARQSTLSQANCGPGIMAAAAAALLLIVPAASTAAGSYTQVNATITSPAHWRRHAGLSCNSVATDLESPKGSSCGSMSLAQCQQKCAASSGCAAITVDVLNISWQRNAGLGNHLGETGHLVSPLRATATLGGCRRDDDARGCGRNEQARARQQRETERSYQKS